MATAKRKKPAPWSAEKYRIALQGDELPGLRSTVKGFSAADGYDLRRIDDWSPAKKRRVREYYEKIHHLYAQERRIVRPRDPQHLRLLQKGFHGEDDSKQFKVAFIPYTDPARLPGAKPKKLRIRYNKRGVVFDLGNYQRHVYDFDKKALLRNPDAEIKRAVDAMPGARLFFIKVDQFQTLNGMSAGIMAQKIKMLMAQYDGRKPIPKGSGNAGDHPKWHKWDKWLDGLYGYSFSKRVDIGKLQRAVSEGIKAAKARRAAQDRTMKRKPRKSK